MQVIAERWKKIKALSLKVGAHSPDSTFCVMEAVAFVAGEKWSDSPECACPVIAAFLRNWNECLPSDAERDLLLKPLIPKLVGTKNPALEEKRSLMAADWLVRVHTPAWLRLAGLFKQAESLEQLPEITAMSQIPSIKGPIEAVRQDAHAAGAAARDAAGDAAGDAAWAAARDAAWAAARDAAGDAAWAAAWAAARDAAGDAAGDAAWAAARDAAGAAARVAAGDAAGDAAGAKLKPTVETLQKSALQLVKRMIDAKEKP